MDSTERVLGRGFARCIEDALDLLRLCGLDFPSVEGKVGLARMQVVSENVDGASNVMPGAYVAPGVVITCGATVGANAVLLGADGNSNPAFVERDATIGANATILPGVVIGAGARVAPGAVVTRSVPPLAIVEGNPAQITGYVNTHPQHPVFETTLAEAPCILPTRVPGVTYHVLTLAADLRGSLSAGEIERDVPFAVKRYFLVFDVPTSETRGEHAHIHCKQFLVAVRGCIRVVVDDGQVRQEFALEQPDRGLYIPPMVWGIQYRYTPDAVLLVLASEHYDASDYIRHYDQFLKYRRQN